MEKPEFVYATFIRTTPEKLWEALTRGDFSVKYWMGFRIEVEQKAGENFAFFRRRAWNNKAITPAKSWSVNPAADSFTRGIKGKGHSGTRQKARQSFARYLRTHPDGSTGTPRLDSRESPARGR